LNDIGHTWKFTPPVAITVVDEWVCSNCYLYFPCLNWTSLPWKEHVYMMVTTEPMYIRKLLYYTTWFCLYKICTSNYFKALKINVSKL
jgi:hypothetical protein